MHSNTLKTESESGFGGEYLWICSTKQKKAEVEALTRLHGYSLAKACDIVCLSQDEFIRSPPVPQSRIKYLPTPEQIRAQCRKLLNERKADGE